MYVKIVLIRNCNSINAGDKNKRTDSTILSSSFFPFCVWVRNALHGGYITRLDGMGNGQYV